MVVGLVAGTGAEASDSSFPFAVVGVVAGAEDALWLEAVSVAALGAFHNRSMPWKDVKLLP